MFTQKARLSWKVGLLVVGLLLALTPATALAQSVAKAVFYEVREKVSEKSTDETSTRIARALEVGQIVYADGTLAGLQGATAEVFAQSRVDLATGIGPMKGMFSVTPVGDNRKFAGKLWGDLNLSLILTNRAPLAPTGGNWEERGNPSSALGGTFEGVAQVPVDCGVLGGPAGLFCYLKPDLSGADLLQPNEFQDGVPLVRFLITFTTVP